jgi:hypothetical protein
MVGTPARCGSDERAEDHSSASTATPGHGRREPQRRSSRNNYGQEISPAPLLTLEFMPAMLKANLNIADENHRSEQETLDKQSWKRPPTSGASRSRGAAPSTSGRTESVFAMGSCGNGDLPPRQRLDAEANSESSPLGADTHFSICARLGS